jgi:hypothetical protein
MKNQSSRMKTSRVNIAETDKHNQISTSGLAQTTCGTSLEEPRRNQSKRIKQAELSKQNQDRSSKLITLAKPK